MSRHLIVSAVVLAFVAASGCGSTVTSPTTTLLHSDIADARGDAIAPAGTSTPPDLIHGTVDVAGGIVTVTVQFAPGTLDSQTTRVAVDLDTDQNASTGNASAGLGIDFSLDLLARNNQATITVATPATCATGGTCFVSAGTGTLTVGVDTLTATAQLSMLGNSTGHVNYRINAYVSPVTVTSPIVVSDWMPDLGTAAAHVS